VFRAVGPAWSDQNLRELAGAVCSPLFLAQATPDRDQHADDGAVAAGDRDVQERGLQDQAAAHRHDAVPRDGGDPAVARSARHC
jgi:hypothetical protein